MSTQITSQKRRESEPNVLAEIAESSSRKVKPYRLLNSPPNVAISPEAGMSIIAATKTFLS
ncbi:hypothetical protein HCEG_07450 [Histoplasma capsulatum var. duboisii H88]|uniref:Uncharacterized protein n=1 Tax=Ajellomyces capsulatus (strain H88) TaxID=544711 RepID=F0UQQ8_AJEC8|nr:hypothetical protein HCEG_07450 [Histoplasma capsulatum var. duboisii H88]